jgi:hypothetical protein
MIVRTSRTFILYLIAASSTALAADSQESWRLFDVWDSNSLDASWVVPGIGLTEEFYFERHPAFLCLLFQRQGHEPPVVGLHPTRHPSAGYGQPFMTGNQQRTQAFGCQIVRSDAEGYEISFQAVDPISGQPLPLKEVVAVFPRGRRTRISLAGGLSVTGFYGNPDIRL